MTDTKMRDVIAALEAADEGSFDLDKMILAHLGYTWRGMGYWSSDDKRMWKESRSLTTSLDAAMSLVPEGWIVERLSIWPHQSTCNLYGTHEGTDGQRWHNFTDGRETATALTLALALCIAALKARHQGEPAGE